MKIMMMKRRLNKRDQNSNKSQKEIKRRKNGVQT